MAHYDCKECHRSPGEPHAADCPRRELERVAVIQRDREAMVAYENESPIPLARDFAERILRGECDHDRRVQGWARHRLEATAERRSLRLIAEADPGPASQQSLAHEMARMAAQALEDG
jgi:hypothetical protein